jgi:hypothetical protein
MSQKKPVGYWQKKKNILYEAREIIERHGYSTVPPAHVLSDIGASSLAGAIFRRYGSIERFREQMGYEGQLNRTRKWSIEGIESEARRIILENKGIFPNTQELCKQGYAGFVAAVATKYPQGKAGLLNKLGIDFDRIPRGQLKDFEFVRDLVQKIKQENNLQQMPAHRLLIKLGYSSLATAIIKYHGGFHKFRVAIGEERCSLLPQESRDLSRALNSATKIKQELHSDRLPCARDLQVMGHSELVYSIHHYHGGFHNFRKLLDENVERVLPGSWQNEEFCVERVREFLQKTGLSILPSHEELIKRGYSSIASAISSYHGFARIRKLLGHPEQLEHKAKWKDQAYALEKARLIIAKNNLDNLPAHRVLVKMGHSSLASGILKYHGGFHKFRELLGGESQRRKVGLVRETSYVISELKRIMQEQHMSELPNMNQIRTSGKGGPSLASAIEEYHGGYSVFMEQHAGSFGILTNRQRTQGLLEGYVRVA